MYEIIKKIQTSNLFYPSPTPPVANDRQWLGLATAVNRRSPAAAIKGKINWTEIVRKKNTCVRIFSSHKDEDGGRQTQNGGGGGGGIGGFSVHMAGFSVRRRFGFSCTGETHNGREGALLNHLGLVKFLSTQN